MPAWHVGAGQCLAAVHSIQLSADGLEKVAERGPTVCASVPHLGNGAEAWYIPCNHDNRGNEQVDGSYRYLRG